MGLKCFFGCLIAAGGFSWHPLTASMAQDLIETSWSSLPSHALENIGSFLTIPEAITLSRVHHSVHNLLPYILLHVCQSPIIMDDANEKDKREFPFICDIALAQAKKGNFLLSLVLNNLGNTLPENSINFHGMFHSSKQFFINYFQLSDQALEDFPKYIKMLHLNNLCSSTLFRHVLEFNFSQVTDLKVHLGNPGKTASGTFLWPELEKILTFFPQLKVLNIKGSKVIWFEQLSTIVKNHPSLTTFIHFLEDVIFPHKTATRHVLGNIGDLFISIKKGTSNYSETQIIEAYCSTVEEFAKQHPGIQFIGLHENDAPRIFYSPREKTPAK